MLKNVLPEAFLSFEYENKIHEKNENTHHNMNEINLSLNWGTNAEKNK
jgi:hypothetical protein